MDSVKNETTPTTSLVGGGGGGGGSAPNFPHHHQRAPRTPESYFNVPESIALLNIVKSERIQSAFQSNRKNHASVWEMVAEVLNRFSARKRSAKQCCNRYENLKKIYTQLKKNPERHVRRNWPYMFLFKEIEEQRGECWGSNGKRLAMITKTHKELSYYHRRRQAAELGVLLGKDAAASVAAAQQQHSLLQSLAHSTDSNSNNSKMERFLPNHFVETQLSEGVYDEAPVMHLEVGMSAAEAEALNKEHELQHEMGGGGGGNNGGGGGHHQQQQPQQHHHQHHHHQHHHHNNNNHHHNNHHQHQQHSLLGAQQPPPPLTNGHAHLLENGIGLKIASLPAEYEKDCNGALNLQTNDNNISMKSEPLSDGEFNPDDIQLMQTNYNGSQNFYPHNIDPNILHPDVIVDTDNLSDCSSRSGDGGLGGDGGIGGGDCGIGSLKSKRKMSTSTDGGDSTNYELIEYLKRREKRDEELLKRMDAREERLLSLLERTVVAIETLATHGNCAKV